MKITNLLLEQLGFKQQMYSNHYWLCTVSPITMIPLSCEEKWVLETNYGADIISEVDELFEKLQTQMYQGGRQEVLKSWEESFKKVGITS